MRTREDPSRTSFTNEAPLPVDGSRRQFLRGVGGASLAIPTLASLLSPKQAKAAQAGNQKIFIAFVKTGSGVFNSNQAPQVSKPDEVMEYAGGTIQRTALKPELSGGNTILSKVFQAPSSLLTPKLVSKMNIIRGVDWADPMAHNRAMLGNFGAADSGKIIEPHLRASIDTIMAHSSSFYPDFNGARRMVQLGTSAGGFTATYGWDNSLTRTGAIRDRSADGIPDPAQYFDIMFGNFKPPSTTDKPGSPRKPVVDLVLESYRRLSKMHTRLSNDDRQRLDDHMERIADIERRLNVTVPVSCAVPEKPASRKSKGSSAAEQAAYFRSFHDITVAALACGLTRVVVYPQYALSVPAGIDMHGAVEHHCMRPDGIAQERMVEANRLNFSEIILPLVAKLDSVVDASGKSLLDRSLVFRVTEMGETDHATSGQVFVTFGGADGAVRTGNFLDYRNFAGPAFNMEWSGVPQVDRRQYLGLTMQQLYGSLLRVMGIPHSEWAEPDNGGYGKKVMSRLKFLHCCSSPQAETFYTPKVWSATSDVLPWFGAA